METGKAQLTKLDDCLEQTKFHTNKLLKSCSIYLGIIAATMMPVGIALFLLGSKINALGNALEGFKPANIDLADLFTELDITEKSVPSIGEFAQSLGRLILVLNEFAGKEAGILFQFAGGMFLLFSIILFCSSIYIWPKRRVQFKKLNILKIHKGG